eukprot:Skav235092  [mRNA]  locus=scaffold711:60166:62604:- [translate_table: standard]
MAPGSKVHLKWRLELSNVWTIEGYLHWDRHEGKETSRAPRWRFTRADGRMWPSLKGKQSTVESQGDLTDEEFLTMCRVKDRMLGLLKLRKSELQKAGTLIDGDAEARWQAFRRGEELLRLREEIEQDRRDTGLQPEWQPHVAISQVEMTAPRKRGPDSFEMCLINLTREGPRKRRKLQKPAQQGTEEAMSSDEEMNENEKENAKPCLKPVSALMKDEAVANQEIEETSALWKELEMDDGTMKRTFSADELAMLWRVAVAKARVANDGQLPFVCLDLAKQHACRLNSALVRLLCVVYAAREAGHPKQVTDLIRTFIKSLVRVLLDQIFPNDQASEMSGWQCDYSCHILRDIFL